MPDAKKSGSNSSERKTTLSALLSVTAPDTRLFILHHMGADCYEAVTEGTVERVQDSRCVEVCGDHVVEKITVDADDWPDTPAPVLIITIGGKEPKK